MLHVLLRVVLSFVFCCVYVLLFLMCYLVCCFVLCFYPSAGDRVRIYYRPTGQYTCMDVYLYVCMYMNLYVCLYVLGQLYSYQTTVAGIVFKLYSCMYAMCICGSFSWESYPSVGDTVCIFERQTRQYALMDACMFNLCVLFCTVLCVMLWNVFCGVFVLHVLCVVLSFVFCCVLLCLCSVVFYALSCLFCFVMCRVMYCFVFCVKCVFCCFMLLCIVVLCIF